jgi:hypothetical protein
VAWQQPKTTWGQAGQTVPGVADFNRIEENIRIVGEYDRAPGYGTATGTNAKTITLSPAPSSYYEGMCFAFRNEVQNTGPVTINVNGLGAKSIKKPNGNDLAPGNLKAGSVYTVRYNGTNFILQGSDSSGDELLVETLELYVNAVSGNDTNDGLTVGTALKTIDKAIEKASKYVAKEVRMNFAAGTYNLSASLGTIRANWIYFSARGAASPPVLNVTDGEIDLSCMYGQTVGFAYEWQINGGISGSAGLVLSDCTLTTSPGTSYVIDIEDAPVVSIRRCTLVGGALGVSIARVGAVSITDTSVSVNAGIATSHIYFENVGSAFLDEVEFLSTGSDGIYAMRGSTVYAYRCSGDLGTGKFIDAEGSIVMIADNSVTGAENEASNGGRIFEY